MNKVNWGKLTNTINSQTGDLWENALSVGLKFSCGCVPRLLVSLTFTLQAKYAQPTYLLPGYATSTLQLEAHLVHISTFLDLYFTFVARQKNCHCVFYFLVCLNVRFGL